MQTFQTTALLMFGLVWFGLVWFYVISTTVGHIMSIPLYTYISYMIWFGLVSWHINRCSLFNVKSSLYKYILNIYNLLWFGLVWFGFIAYQSL